MRQQRQLWPLRKTARTLAFWSTPHAVVNAGKGVNHDMLPVYVVKNLRWTSKFPAKKTELAKDGAQLSKKLTFGSQSTGTQSLVEQVGLPLWAVLASEEEEEVVLE